MAKIVVFAEQREQKLKKFALEAVSTGYRLAQAKGENPAIVYVGELSDENRAQLAAAGAGEIWVPENAQLAAYSPDGYAALIQAALDQLQPEVILFSASAMGKELAPLVAAKYQTAVLSDVTAVDWEGDQLTVTRPVYAGKAFLKIAAVKMPAIVTLRPNVFPFEEHNAAGEVRSFTAPSIDPKAVVIKTEMKASTRPELTEASIIVSGGRGMGGPENYTVIEALADTLGAAVGASRAAVDAGWRPHSDQVGQTGKTVSPDLYIACGISGAIQHLAGMSSSKVIVAINTDPDAPIFQVADYGIVGDLFEVVPALDAEIKKLKEA